jgi:hypothetical protein
MGRVPIVVCGLHRGAEDREEQRGGELLHHENRLLVRDAPYWYRVRVAYLSSLSPKRWVFGRAGYYSTFELD